MNSVSPFSKVKCINARPGVELQQPITRFEKTLHVFVDFASPGLQNWIGRIIRIKMHRLSTKRPVYR
jgi:hypothetical protein